MLTDRIFSGSLKDDNTISFSAEGFDATSFIPIDFETALPKANVSIMDYGKMLLQFAKEGETKKVHELMSRGAPFTTDWLGTSPLHLAAQHNHLETCEVLLRAGISKDARTKVDRTPLHFAVFEGHEKIVELLLLNKCEIDAKDMLKMTPLHWAVENRHPKIVEMLLECNADPTVVSKFCKTPLTIAYETEQFEVIKKIEMAIQTREDDPEQVQEATDRLVLEMQQQEMKITFARKNNNKTDQLTAPMIEMDNDDSTPYQYTVSPPISSTKRISNTSTINLSNTIDDNSSNNLIDSDDGTSLSDAIIQLQNVDSSKGFDMSTLQILKDHGITMLPQEDTETSLISSALESGRKLVLSEGGKLLLNDTKFKKNNIFDSPILTTSQTNDVLTNSVKIAKKPQLILPSNKNMPLMKTNKVIKILSAEEFKQMCGGDVTNALKKFSSDGNSIKVQTIKNNQQSSIYQVHPPKFKKPIMQKSKFSTIPIAARLPNQNEIKTMKPVPQITENVRLINSHSPTLVPTTNIHSNSPATSFSSRTISLAGITEIKSPTTMAEMERQILELRKITDDLRKQFELSQKQNEEFRLRLEKLEQDREFQDEEI